MMTSLYSGVTGMKTHSTGLNVVSNNLANLNTVSYKQSSILYSDLMSQAMNSTSSTDLSQVGMGASVGSIRTIFTQGGFMDGSAVTDLAIDGKGYFAVQKDGITEYTRAGNFRFTKEGELLDPNGWNIMGRAIVNGQESGTATPIKIDMSDGGIGSMKGKATGTISACSQLGALKDSTSDSANPFFALASSWKGTASNPLGSAQYSYSEGIQFYDASGNLQNATIYYDLAGTSGGQKTVEYVVAMKPSQDASALAGTEAAGLLMAGTLTFSSSGELQNITAFTPPASGDPTDLASWNAAGLSANGFPQFSATTSGGTQSIGLDMGLTLSGSASVGFANAAAANADPLTVYAINQSAIRNPESATTAGTSNTTLYSRSDGYANGYLQDLEIGADGIVSGIYSNGQAADLYRITTYRFTSEDGLVQTSGNRYQATPEAGAVEEGVPGTENYGKVSAYKLEQSNVDYATEFTNLIITQRGFQMNSKVVTTCDTMLQRALEIKR